MSSQISYFLASEQGMKSMKSMKKLYSAALIGAVLFFPMVVLAAMSSTNYTIYADSIGLGGGLVSTSSAYTLNDTIANSLDAVNATSSSYIMRGGYQSLDRSSLSVQISTSSLNLGTLDRVSVKTAETTVTVTSNAASGYTLSVNGLSGTMPDPVQGGTVRAGNNAYGVAVSGASAAFVGDQGVTDNMVLAQSSGEVSNDATTLTFKAAMSGSSVPGSYSQSISLLITANF